jgi:predicted dinucleotide-binding enzyme
MPNDMMLMSSKLKIDLATNDRVQEIIQATMILLNGIPIVQAISILADIRTILINGPVVDMINPRFQEVLKSYPFSP